MRNSKPLQQHLRTAFSVEIGEQANNLLPTNKRREMRKIALVIASVVIPCLFLAGCGGGEEPVPKPDIPILNNDLAGGKVVIDSVIEGMTVTREYTTSYDAKHWRITDSKSLVMTLSVSGEGDKTVLMEHMHADVALKSYSQSLDGWKQDTMDDSIHGGIQPGFLVSQGYEYQNVFAIEGFSQTLIDGWMFMFSGWGGGEIREYRLTEDNLVTLGKVYGNKIQVVYDLLIKAPTEEYWHTVSFIDEFLVPTVTK
jgi:hypothetical protein